MNKDTKLCAGCHVAPRNSSSSSYCVPCKRTKDAAGNAKRGKRTPRELCLSCDKPKTGANHAYCLECLLVRRQEQRKRNIPDKDCARCGVTPRVKNMSYCRECHRALGRESRERVGGKKPQLNCSRCDALRDGVHPTYCVKCNNEYKEKRFLEPCGRCGVIRLDDDRTHPNYCRNCWRGWWMARKYGMTLTQYDQLLINQNGRCALCFCEHNGRSWHIDHSHVNGRVRGILCDMCNRGIGQLQDDPAILRRAADYIESFQ